MGGRSDVGQSDWFWDNLSTIIDSKNPPSDPSLCQQRAWPLTYDNGINLDGKKCSEPTYFLCEVKCEFKAISICKHNHSIGECALAIERLLPIQHSQKWSQVYFTCPTVIFGM